MDTFQEKNITAWKYMYYNVAELTYMLAQYLIDPFMVICRKPDQADISTEMHSNAWHLNDMGTS